MNTTLYESIYSYPNPEGLKIIKSLPVEEYSFVLLIGINEDKKNKFYQEILKQSKLSNSNSLDANEMEIEESSIMDQKGACFCIDKTSLENKIIWCNTENIPNNNFKDHLVYLKNIAKYCSKIILFIEYTHNSKLVQCDTFLNELLIPQSNFKDIDLLLCIDMANPSLNSRKYKQSINSDYFKTLKSLTQNFKIQYLDDDNDLDTSQLLQQLRDSPLTSNLKKASFSNFLDIIDEPPIKIVKENFNIPCKEEDIDKILSLDSKPNINIENAESQIHIVDKEVATPLDYYDEKMKNYLNYLSDYCNSEKELENWKSSKEDKIRQEMEVILKVYEEQKKYLSIKKDFEIFLQTNKVKITEDKIKSSQNIESIINKLIKEFQNSFPSYKISENLMNSRLSKTVKDFIYNDVEIIIINRDSNLKKIINRASEDFSQLLKNFKNKPYKFDLDKLFKKRKEEWFRSLKESCSILITECTETLEIRIAEMEKLVRTIKSQIPELDFRIMECIMCSYLGSMKSANGIDFITINDLNTEIMDQNIRCDQCWREFKAIDIVGKDYEFEIDSRTNAIKSIRQVY